MSRTTAHRPYWSRADWYEPSHSSYCPNLIPASWLMRGRTADHVCDLPAEPDRHRVNRPRRGVPSCFWEPVWPGHRQTRKLFGNPVPRWYVEHIWHNPERVRERDGLRNLAREYNAYADLADDDFPCWQARHGASWDWD